MQNHYDFNPNQILVINKSCTFIQDFDIMFSLENCNDNQSNMTLIQNRNDGGGRK